MAKDTWEKHASHVIQRPEEWSPPSQPIPPLKHVEVQFAYRCRHEGCTVGFVVQSNALGRSTNHAWREHQRNEHGCSEFDSVGRPPVSSALVSRARNRRGEAYQEPWGPLLPVQRLFARGPFHQVEQPTEPSRPLQEAEVSYEHDENIDPASYNYKTEVVPAAASAFDQVFNRLTAIQLQEQEARLRHIAQPAEYQVDLWAREVGFSTRLQGLDRDKARALADKPTTDDGPVPTAVWEVTKTLLQKCHRVAKDAGSYLRQTINRVQPSLPPLKPWIGYTRNNSVLDHARTLQGCMVFFARTQLDEAARALIPMYRIDDEVQSAWTALLAHLSTNAISAGLEARPTIGRDLEEAERLTLVLLIRLLQQQGIVNEADELPLITALTVLGIQPGQGRFARPEEYSRTLAGFSKMSRCAVLQYALDGKHGLVAATESCLTRSANHTMNWVTGSKALARKIAKETPRQGKLTWLPDQDAFLYGQHKLSLSNLRAIVHNALCEHRRILCEELLFVKSIQELPKVPWETMVDRLDYTPRGSCWTDPANQALLEHGKGWLKNRVSRFQAERFLCPNQRSFQGRAVLRFQQAMASWREWGAALGVWAIGMPIRGTSLTQYRWCNNDNGEEQRNLVVQGGRLTLIGGHTKATWAGVQAPMHVLPRELANVWGWYIWLVLPFWDILRHELQEVTRPADDSLLFLVPLGRPATTWVSDAMVKASSCFVQPGLTLNPSRQLCTAFVRKYIPGDILAGGKSIRVDARQSQHVGRGHSSAQPYSANTDDYREMENSDNEDENNDDVYISAGDDEYSSLAAQALGHTKRDPFAHLRGLIKDWSAIETQSGHSLELGLSWYGGSVDAIPGLDELTLALWSAVSDYWHWVLRFPSTQATQERGTACKRPASVVELDGAQSLSTKRVRRSQQVTQEDALQLLRWFVNKPDAEFRGNQWTALDAMMNRSRHSLLLVEPTGGGKSATFILPTLVEGAGLTVAVFPFIALRRGVYKRCYDKNIRCVEWTPARASNMGQYYNANLVLVQAEYLPNNAFLQFLQVLKVSGRLDRIVVDEAHVRITQEKWRTAVTKYNILSTIGVPLVMLTATLPVRDEKRFFDKLEISSTSVTTIRSSTVRRNVAYTVTPLTREFGQDNEPPDYDDVTTFLSRHRAAYTGTNRKTMIFVPTKKRVEWLAKITPNSFAYYHGIEDGPEILEAFEAAKDAILFCTSAADHGYDPLDVDEVIHLYITSSLSEYLQGTGRAGRDGRPSIAILLVGFRSSSWSTSAEDQENQRIVMEYAQLGSTLDVAKCRRVVIDAYMDGVTDRIGCKPQDGELLCDVCAYRATPCPNATSSVEDILGERCTSNPTLDYAATSNSRLAISAKSVGCSALGIEHQAQVAGTRPLLVPQASRPRLIPPQPTSPQPTSSRSTSSRSTSSQSTIRQSSLPRASPTQTSPPLYTPPTSPLPLNSTTQASCSQLPCVARRGAPRSLTPQLLPLDQIAECMAWRAIWGKDGATTLTPQDRVKSTLQFWKWNCRAHIYEDQEYTHTVDDCTEVPGVHSQIRQWSAPWTRSGGWRCESGSCCYTCKAPSSFCRWRNCTKEWDHVVVEAWAICTHHPRSQPWYIQHLSEHQLEGMESPDTMTYLGRKLRVRHPSGHFEVTILLNLLVQMTEIFFSQMDKNAMTLIV